MLLKDNIIETLGAKTFHTSLTDAFRCTNKETKKPLVPSEIQSTTVTQRKERRGNWGEFRKEIWDCVQEKNIGYYFM